MDNPKDISQYKIIGTLLNNSNFSMWIASYPQSNSSNNKMYLINRFTQIKNNWTLFRDLFSCYSQPSKPKDIVNFFSSKDSFYVVFNYTKGENIIDKFNDDNNTLNYAKRCQILKELLLKINDLNYFPLYILLCFIDPNNIYIDADNRPQIMYNLSKVEEFKEYDNSLLFKNLSNIISIILKNELKNKSYGHLKIVLEKCNNNLYKSIPELIVELEKAENLITKQNFVKSIKSYIKRNKKKIIHYSIIFSSVLLICALIFVVPFALKYLDKNGPVVSLGNIKYNVSSNQNTETEILPIDTDSTKVPDTFDYSVSPDSGLPSEDYVVQYGDTIESICSEHYSNAKFKTTIETFNNVSDASLVAGMILKLPTETSASDYIMYR